MRDDLDIPMPAMNPGGASTEGYRVPRARDASDPNTRRMAMIAGGIVSVFVVFGGIYSFMSHRRVGVPVVEADARPLREKPVNAGGMQVAGRDESIMTGEGEGKAALSPPAEAPSPQGLRQAAAPVVTPAPAAVAPAPAPVVAAPPAPVVAAPVTAPVAVEKPPVSVEKPPVVARTAPVETKPAVKQASPTVAMPARQVVPLAAGHGAQVQLAAVGSEPAAQAEWARLAHKFPDLLGGRKPAISKFERDGKVFWRVRTGGFADAGGAKALCDQMKAKGGGCTVASF